MLRQAEDFRSSSETDGPPLLHIPSDVLLTVFISLRFQTNYSIAVLPMSKLQVVCPNPAMIPIPVERSTPKEELYENLWMVEKQAYDACAIDTSKYQNRLLMRCDTPLQLRYFSIVFQRFSAVGPDGLEFEPGKDYFFIGKGDSTMIT